MKNFIHRLVEPLVDYPNEIVITEEERNDEIVYHLQLNKDDVGKVIGKQGRVAKSLRTLVYAAAGKQKKRVHLEID